MDSEAIVDFHDSAYRRDGLDQAAIFLREDRAAQLDVTERDRYINRARMRHDASQSGADTLGDDFIVDGTFVERGRGPSGQPLNPVREVAPRRRDPAAHLAPGRGELIAKPGAA